MLLRTGFRTNETPVGRPFSMMTRSRNYRQRQRTTLTFPEASSMIVRYLPAWICLTHGSGTRIARMIAAFIATRIIIHAASQMAMCFRNGLMMLPQSLKRLEGISGVANMKEGYAKQERLLDSLSTTN